VWDTGPVTCALSELPGLTVAEVSRHAPARAEVKAALAAHHYLGYRLPVGENVQYAVRDGAGRLLAALVFGAAAWKCGVRDRWIGWNRERRERGLGQIANNSRFLILPWVRVPHLASWILGQVARRIGRDWQSKYGHGVRLLETFVDRERFAGTCYRAANWIGLGTTMGRSRQDRDRTLQVPVKDIYVYPLCPDFREGLCG
jgi:Druantia protein DruA